MQKRNGTFLPISYYSKSLTPSQRRYPAIKQELMAIANGVLAFKYYLYGRHFTILSDSKPLKHYSKITSPANIVSRWLLTLGEYDYSFVHIPGKENLLADFFSRTPFPNTSDISTNPDLLVTKEVLPIHSEILNNIHTHSDARVPQTTPPVKDSSQYLDNLIKSVSNLPPDPLLEITNSTILREQLIDQNLSKYYKEALNKTKSKESPYFSICKSTKILLYKNPKNPASSPKIALPTSLRIKALNIAHVSHLGIHKTYQFLSQKYYWRKIYEDTANFVQSCTKCISAKSHRVPQAPFQNNPIPERPGDFISMDLVGPFKNGYHILTIIDRFSRYLQLYPIRNISSENVIKSLFKYITAHGRPAMIHTDLGKQFTSQIFNDFTTKFGIRLIHSTSNHPQCNAISERINQSIKATILALQEDGYNFFNSTDIHQMMYNSATHSTTKFSPNHIHFGRELSTLYDTYLPFKPFLATDNNRTYFSIMQDLEKLYTAVYDNLQLAQKIQNSKQHKKAKLRKVNIGDIVYLKSSHTFKPKHTGPFIVTQLSGPVNFIIKRSKSPEAKEFKIHIDRLWIPVPRKQHLVSDDIITSWPVPPELRSSTQHDSTPNPPPVENQQSQTSDTLCDVQSDVSAASSQQNSVPTQLAQNSVPALLSQNSVPAQSVQNSGPQISDKQCSKHNIPVTNNNVPSFAGYGLRPLDHRKNRLKPSQQ